jgi:hypothetical protein
MICSEGFEVARDSCGSIEILEGTCGGDIRLCHPVGSGRRLGWYRAGTIGPAAAAVLANGGNAMRVHSVFALATNIEVEGTGRFLALSGPAGRVFPHAVALQQAVDFLAWRLVVGSQARLVEGSIHLQGHEGEIVVDLWQAIRLPSRPLPSIDRLGNAHRASVSRLAEIQGQEAHDLRIDVLSGARSARTALGKALRDATLALGAAAHACAGSNVSALDAWARLSSGDALLLASLRQAVAGLVGLGAGLTPSGDDFLCGFMAAARASNPGSTDAGEGIVEILHDAVQRNTARTSQLSAFLLRSAIQDFWPAPLVDLAEAIVRDRENQARTALDGLCGLGHSSGADIATGFLFGLEYLMLDL